LPPVCIKLLGCLMTMCINDTMHLNPHAAFVCKYTFGMCWHLLCIHHTLY